MEADCSLHVGFSAGLGPRAADEDLGYAGLKFWVCVLKGLRASSRLMVCGNGGVEDVFECFLCAIVVSTYESGKLSSTCWYELCFSD